MILKIIYKLINLPIAFRIKFFPIYNRLLLKYKQVIHGCNTQIFNRIYITGEGKITIGDDFMFTSGDCINPIGSNLRGCFFTEKEGEIKIGHRVGMSSTRMWIRTKLTIEDDVKIGGNVLIIDTDSHPIDYRMRSMRPKNSKEIEAIDNMVKTAPITIKEHAWIGANCTILKGVTIGARSIIGAGSVVTKSIPADCIAAGNPARVIKSISNT